MTQKSRTRTLVLLGATGKLGRLVRAVWQAHSPQDWTIVPLARRPAPGVQVWHPDGGSAPLERADVVAALWGVTSGSDLAANTALAQAAIALGDRLGASAVLHMSSAAVYGPGPRPWSETDPTQAPNAYGAAKRDMEQAILAAPARAAQIILRLGNVVGADSLFASLARPGPITLHRYADGHGPLRSYLCARTLAEALLCLPAAPDRSVLNLAEIDPVRMEDIVATAGRDLSWQPAPDPAGQVATLDVSQAARLMPLAPERANARAIVDDWRRFGSALT